MGVQGLAKFFVWQRAQHLAGVPERIVLLRQPLHEPRAAAKQPRQFVNSQFHRNIAVIARREAQKPRKQLFSVIERYEVAKQSSFRRYIASMRSTLTSNNRRTVS